MGIDISTLNELEIANSVIKKIEEWIEKLNIPQDLKEYGVSDSDVKDISIAASKVTRLLDNNPKQMSLDDIENVYRKLLRSEEHTSELQSRFDLVCRLLLEKKNT